MDISTLLLISWFVGDAHCSNLNVDTIHITLPKDKGYRGKMCLFIESSGIPVTHAGVLQVASTTTCCIETTQTKCGLQSKGFLPRAIVYFQDLPIKYWVGSSKCVIKFFVKSKNFMLGNMFIIPASNDVILLFASPRKVKLSYTVSVSHSKNT